MASFELNTTSFCLLYGRSTTPCDTKERKRIIKKERKKERKMKSDRKILFECSHDANDTNDVAPIVR